MKKNSRIILFLSIIILGTTITARRNNWLIMWTGLEINIIAFLPLIIINKLNTPEAGIIYFLIQRLGSIILLFSVIIRWKRNILTTFSIIIKIGAAPFHFWIILIIDKIRWINCILLITWQKIAPIIIIIHIKPIIILALIRIIVGAIGGLNQTSVRKLIAFSSVNHIGWILSISELKRFLFIKYLIIYSIITILLVLFLNNKKIFHLNQITEKINNLEKFNFSIIILRIGGLPPFIGFINKWLVIIEIINKKIIFIIVIIIITSIITLFFYIRMIRSIILLEYNFIKIIIEYNPQKSQIIILIINLFILPITAITLV